MMRGRTTVTGLVVIQYILHASSTLCLATPGDLDPSFGTGGLVTSDFSDFDGARAIAIQQDGKLIVGGYTRGKPLHAGVTDFALARYNANGTLDTTFGVGGLVSTDFGLNSDFAYAVAILPDGRILAVGGGQPGTTATDFALALYNTDGNLDADFGANGLVTTDFGWDRNDDAFDVAIQADGKIVVAGRASLETYPDFGVARYNTDGSLDANFGANGLVTTDFGSFTDEAFAVQIQADGKIVAAGGALMSSQAYFALARYNTDGSLDTTFGAGGLVTTDFGLSWNVRATALAIQANGRIVAVGFYGTDSDFALARYNTDGSLDATFGESGLVTTDFASNDDHAFAVAILPDGKILAVGRAVVGSQADFALARYNANGTLDATFGVSGLVTTDFGSNYDAAKAVAIDADGKIVAGGDVLVEDNRDFALARYLSDAEVSIPTVSEWGLLVMLLLLLTAGTVVFTKRQR